MAAARWLRIGGQLCQMQEKERWLLVSMRRLRLLDPRRVYVYDSRWVPNAEEVSKLQILLWLLFPEDNCQCHLAMHRNKEQFVVPWKKVEKHFSSLRKKWMKVRWRLPKTYANNIHKTVVPAFEFKTSRKLHQNFQHRGFSTTWSTSWLFWNIQLAKNPLFPTVSELVNMTKPSEKASSWSYQIFGRHEKFWQIFIIWKIIQLITALLYHVN